MKQVLKFIHDFLKYGLEHFGLYYSTYTAYVYDREDPENMSRLKLIIPVVTGSNVLNEWAYPVGVFSGKGYGMQVLPKRGDVVKVRFYMGKISKPQWEHGYFAKDEKPKDIQGYDNYWFKTPSGNLVIIDDKKNTIKIELSHGNYIFINNNAISLVRNNKKISLGKLDDSDEPAVLGNKNEETLNKILSILQTLNTTLQSIGSTDSGVASGLGLTYAAALATLTTALQTELGTLGTLIPTTKSKNVTLD